MKHILTLIICAVLFLLAGCAGEDQEGNDKTPPIRPTMIPHMGDTGDFPATLNDSNNGIDAVPEGQWIRLQWNPFVDNDLSHVHIYRFSDIDPTSTQIANIPANTDTYLDQSPLVERTWYSYYIELFDASGNSTVSDTVSYAILAKTNLLSPENGDTVDASNLEFFWNRADDRTGFYRVLLFDEDYLLYWHEDFHLATEDDPLHVQLPIMTPPIPSGSTMRWRVDYFDWDEEYQMYMGSESEERIIHIL